MGETPSINENEDEVGIHMHCLSCYSSSCSKFPQCHIIHCPFQCGLQLHQCKQSEHFNICRNRSRECVNRRFGCHLTVTSIEMMSHLEVCPASVVQCSINWNRAPLHSEVREQWLPFHEGNPPNVEGDLDIELAIADQKRLNKEYRHRMIRGARRRISKENVGRIDLQRRKKLEQLLTGKKSSSKHQLGSRHANTTNCDDHTFVTCDELFSDAEHEEDNKDHVSNTNMRDSYFDVPNMYIYNGNFKQHIITKLTSKNKWPARNTELTEEERTARRKVLSNVKLSPRPLGLNVMVECLPAYYDQYPLYRFGCASLFRRDQYKWHCRNSHGDIGFNLNGWLLQRCPLANYGCPYSQFRLKPKDRNIRFVKTFTCFAAPYNTSDDIHNGSDDQDYEISLLLDLPTEILVYLLFFLDNLSLNCLAKTCHYLRGICCSMVDELGIVVTTWCKRSYEKSGSSSWKEDKKIRLFTTAFSPVREWRYSDAPNIGEHMRTCAFFKRSCSREDKIKLPQRTY